MSSSSRRTYYDPKQPRLLSDQEIASLTPAECEVACLQIDQILVSILQNIDADFGRSHRVITDKILPDLERYGEASKGIWEGLKFWQGFFEASVNVKLSGNNEDSVAGPSVHDSSHQVDEASVETVQQNDKEILDPTANFDPPNSPFETLKQGLRQNLGIPSKAGEPLIDAPSAQILNESHQTGSSASLRRPPHWHDLSMDSPDATLQMPVPKDLSLLIDSQSGNSLDSDISMSSFLPANERPPEEGSHADNSPSHIRKHASRILLHQALLRDTMSGNHKRQTISTPAKPLSRRDSVPRIAAGLPPEMADPNWNGLTDLRKVPLDGLMGTKMPTRRFGGDGKTDTRQTDEHFGEEEEESLRAGISPPQTIHFSVPRFKLAQTPSKEAARLVTRDVLETARLRAGYANPTDLEDSPPLEPPSVLREWKQRGYESLYQSRTEEDSQQNDSHSTLGLGKPDQVQPGPSRDVSVSRALIDLREEDPNSSKQSKNLNRLMSQRDDPFSENSTGRSGESQQLFSGPSTRGGQIGSNRYDRSMDDMSDSPTLFGVRYQPKQSLNQPVRLTDPSTSNAIHNLDKGSQPFVPMRPDEIDTFFGGNLLESECFEPSPLQGKRIRYTDPKDPNK